MLSMRDGACSHDPQPGPGWVAQLVAVVRDAILEPGWAAAIKLLLFAIVGVLLYLAILLVPGWVA